MISIFYLDAFQFSLEIPWDSRDLTGSERKIENALGLEIYVYMSF